MTLHAENDSHNLHIVEESGIGLFTEKVISSSDVPVG